MRSRWLGFWVAGLALVLSALAYSHLPARVPSHWNVHGKVDGYSSRLVGAFLLPAMILGFAVLAQILPKIDPKRRNYERFQSTYWLFMNGVLLFVLGLHAAMLAAGIGMHVNMNRLLPVGMGLLFVLLGNYMGRVRPNWFVGVRTPWTLSSDTVWRKTHRTAGQVFVAGGIVIALSTLLPSPASIIVLVAAIIVMPAIPIIQSYVLWKREQTNATQ